MLKKSLVNLINLQVNRELYSAYLYLDMAAYATDQGLVGFAKWFKIQAQEERDHALYFVEYLQHVNATVVYDVIAKPERNYKDVAGMLEEQLKHEQFVSASIANILAEAIKEKDFLTQEYLQWFIREQGEEEKNANDLILAFGLYGKTPASLFELDHGVGKREYHKSVPSLD
jgi:ferritin